MCSGALGVGIGFTGSLAPLEKGKDGRVHYYTPTQRFHYFSLCERDRRRQRGLERAAAMFFLLQPLLRAVSMGRRLRRGMPILSPWTGLGHESRNL